MQHRDDLTSGKLAEFFQAQYMEMREHIVINKIINSYMLKWCAISGRKVAIIYITQEADKLFLFVAPDADDQSEHGTKALIVSSTEIVVNESNTPAKSIIYVLKVMIPPGKPIIQLQLPNKADQDQ